MSTKINHKIKRVQTGTLSGVTVEECRDQDRLIDNYTPLEYEDAPHMLVHNDLGGNNIIVDANSEFRWYIQ